MTLNPPLIVEMETMANAAMPALETRLYDGWLLRFAQGYTKRANSVHPLHASSLDLDTKIAFCESQYATRGQPTIFKMTPASEPMGLDVMLATRGYAFSSPTLMQICNLAGADTTALLGAPQLTEQWLKAYQMLDPVKEQYHQILYDSLAIIPFPTWYAMLTDQDGNITAVGVAVQQSDFLGIFNIVVSAAQRGRGLGRQIMNILLSWGAQQGAQQAYLQVSADNVPALGLYRSFGFQTVYEYWYRLLNP